MLDTAARIVQLIQTRRFTLRDEKALQYEMQKEFEKEGLAFRREVRLSDADIVDFLFEGGIALEVKTKGGKRDIYVQCVRYCASPEVNCLILATNVAIGFPPTIAGKPAAIASLGKGWL